jgi:hypothetical protein
MNNQTTARTMREQIAHRAYAIWEKEGRPHGQHEAHWFRAERQLMATQAQDEHPSRDMEAMGRRNRTKSTRNQGAIS